MSKGEAESSLPRREHRATASWRGARRRGIAWRIALAAIAVVGCAGGSAAPPGTAARSSMLSAGGPRPDLVVLLADDLGFGDLGRRGSPARTPNLDRFFAEGLELRRFYVSPVCTPTRAALLTGRSAMGMGLQYHVLKPWSRHGLAPEIETLPEVLRRADYQTALVGKWHLGHATLALQPNEQGFERFYGHLLGASYFDHEFSGARDFQRDGVTVDEKGYTTELLGDEMLRVLEEREPNRPLFLLGAFGAPHAPWEAPDAVVATYPKLGRDRRQYAAMLDVLDRQIGRVLDAIAASGRDTLVVFLSDNGAVTPPGSNAPLRGAKGSLFEGGIRVPAAIQWPGHLPAASASDQLMRDSDLFATLAAAAGIAAADRPAGVEGSDLLPALAAGTTLPHAPLLFAIDASRAQSHAVIDWPWKLILSEPRAPTNPAKGNHPHPRARRDPEILLFDLATDPAETRDRSADEVARTGELLEEIAAWRATHPSDGLRLERAAPKGWRKPQDWSLVR